MSEEYQNNFSGTPSDENDIQSQTDDFATAKEEPILSEITEEIVPQEDVTTDDSAQTQPEETVESAPQPHPTADTASFANEPPVYSNASGAYAQNQGYQSYQGYGQPYPNQNPNPYYANQQYGYNPQYNQGMYQNQPVQSGDGKKKKKGPVVFLVILAVVVFLGLIFGCVSFVVKRTINNNPSAETYTASIEEKEETEANAPVLQTKPNPDNSRVLSPADVAAKVKPSVVAIIVYANNSGGVASEGSGVLWKEDDTGKYTYIITCAHVVSGSGYTYTVQTEDGTQYDAELIGADAKTDLGVIRIEASGLTLAEFGDSSALRVGDPVYAIGNPGGTEFFGSFTDGVVSAIDRSVQSTYTMICIQHTAAINPGNSGGALVNAYGQVIGINSLKIIDTEYEGMGFAVPIKSAQPIINSLAAYGYVPNRPKLGISYTEAINYQQYSMIIKIKGMPSGSLIITEINEDSALANTEAKQYDMIVAVDGKDMTSPDVLLDRIENGKVGDEITLTLCRIDNNYQTTEFDVKVKLVEEKKVEEQETTTAPTMIDPFDYFNGMFW